MNNWNYHIGLEDYSVMQGQAHTIDDLGAPRINKASKGDDLIYKFYNWYNKALENDGGQPYFARWTGDNDYQRVTVGDGVARDWSDIDDDELSGARWASRRTSTPCILSRTIRRRTRTAAAVI